MNPTISGIRCSLQVALLGAVTPNLRAVSILYENESMIIFFYYEFPPSEDEIEISEIVGSEVIADFVIPVDVKQITLGATEKIPENGLRIFHRHEP